MVNEKEDYAHNAHVVARDEDKAIFVRRCRCRFLLRFNWKRFRKQSDSMVSRVLSFLYVARRARAEQVDPTVD